MSRLDRLSKPYMHTYYQSKAKVSRQAAEAGA